jgi:hypothetical protein
VAGDVVEVDGIECSPDEFLSGSGDARSS